jgi:hypothetical protein
MGLFSWDNSETTEADEKWITLRDSGYKGPIDQDGNAVEDLQQWIKDNS